MCMSGTTGARIGAGLLTGGSSELVYQMAKGVVPKPLAPVQSNNPLSISAPAPLARPLGTKVGDAWTSSGFNGLQV